MEDLAWFTPWMPLAHVPFATQCIGSRIYVVDETTYLFTVPHNRLYERDELSPYVTIVLFAPNIGAAERCVNGILAADTGEPLSVDALRCLGVDDWSYENLTHIPGAVEAAEYGSDGKFLHVRLEWKTPEVGEQVNAYFRERRVRSQHRPYAVQYRGVVPPRLQ